MNDKKYVVLILLLNTFLFFFYGRPVIEGDGLTNYIIARGFAEEFNFNVKENKYHPNWRMFHFIMSEEEESQGVLFSGGYAVLASPFIICTRYICNLIPFIDNLQPYYSWPPFVDSIAILIANYIYLNIMMVALFYFLKEMFISRMVFLSLFISLIGTPLAFYTFFSPGYSQLFDTFAFSMFYVFSFQYFDTVNSEKKYLFLVSSGVFLGLSIFIRNINIIFAVPFVIAILAKDITKKEGFSCIIRRLAVLFAGIMPFILILMFYNYIQYENPFTSGYLLHGNISFRSTIIYQLFHPDRGLFIYTPLAVMILLSLLFIREHKFYVLLNLGYFISFFAIAQFFQVWRGGISFGNRFSVHLFPIYVFSVCLLFKQNGKCLLKYFTIIFTLYSFLLFNLFITGMGTKGSRAHLFRERDRYNVVDIVNSSVMALSNIREEFDTGVACGLLYTKLYHDTPSVLFLPFNNIKRNFLTFLYDISVEYDKYLSVDIVLYSFSEDTWYSRLFICREDKADLYIQDNLILFSTPMVSCDFNRGFNTLKYRFYKDKTYDILINDFQIKDRTRFLKRDNFQELAINEENIGVLFYYAKTGEEMKILKHYRNQRTFNIDIFYNYFMSME